MRMYGMLPSGDPGRLAPRRKTAAAGPKHKAARKRIVRGKRAARGGLDFGALGRAAIGSVPVVGGVASELAGQLMGGKGGKTAKGEGGGKRRRANPANVHALRRSLRRVEGFGHLVARVNRMLPRAHKYQVHPVLKHKRRRKSA
jgi:hypothetical protein